MRIESLANFEAGIDRRRIKAGAKRDALYDLVNAYIDEDGSVVSRPGTNRIVTLPAGTKGMCAFNGYLVVFAHEAVADPGGFVRVEIITDPSEPTSPIERIHFAAPYLNRLYVVAEFESGNVWHFWLYEATTWAPKTMITLGETRQPTTPNGFLYVAHRPDTPAPLWAPNVPRTVGEFVEPTQASGWKFECTDTTGDTPRSGATEPAWNTGTGAITVEQADAGTTVDSTQPGTGPTTPTPGGSGSVPGPIFDRYDPIGYLIER
jgi:hypothetical protein